MADIIEEIISDQKDAKRLYYFRKLLPVVIIVTVIVAVLMTSYSYYKKQQENHNQEIGDMLIDIIAGNIHDEQMVDETLQNIITNSGIKQAELAKLKTALNPHYGETDGALQYLEAIIDDSDNSEITRSYARILWISLILDIEKLDNDMQTQARNYLQYFKDRKQVFYTSATLLKALFYFKNNQLDLAKSIATEITKMPKASIVIKEQANALLTVLKYKK